MTDNQEMYCSYCGRDSDLLWSCEECGNIYDSIPSDEVDDEEVDDYEIGEVIRCPLCDNLVETVELVDGCLCPICFEDLSEDLEDSDEE